MTYFPSRLSRRNRCRNKSATSGSSSTTRILTLTLLLPQNRSMPAGQSDGELSVLADTAVDLDRAAMLLGHDVIADREAKTGSLAGRLCREERLEQLVFDLGRNSHAVVADPDFDSIAEISCGHPQSRLETRVASFSLAFGGRIKAIAE